MKTVPLPNGRFALVDDADYDKVSCYDWSNVKGHNTWYAIRVVYEDGKMAGQQKMHQLLTGYPQTDHRDGNGLNNQRHNLRPATKQQNAANARKRTTRFTSKFKGVGWFKAAQKWRTRVIKDKKTVYWGLFDSELDAAKAYNTAAVQHFGEYACLNEVPDA